MVHARGCLGRQGEAAWGVFNDSSYLAVGWGKLEVHTNPNITDDTTAMAAGKLEGKLTAVRIYQSAMNGGCALPMTSQAVAR